MEILTRLYLGNKLKKYVRSFGGKTCENFIIWFLIKTGFNNRILLFSMEKAKRNCVNLNFWKDKKNVGDAISPVIVDHVCRLHSIDIDRQVGRTKHFYAVGSIITAGCQDCTIWGSGLLNFGITGRVRRRNLDIRAVRGPLTRAVLLDYGFHVPDIYGDPAILMPGIYNPTVEKKYDVGVVVHLSNDSNLSEGFHQIKVATDDYKTFIREIKSCRLVISSSLHGIILAEVYGVPAMMLRPESDLLKYYDYYYSTGRFEFPVAESVEEALSLAAPEIPDFEEMADKLLEAFPYDLWE